MTRTDSLPGRRTSTTTRRSTPPTRWRRTARCARRCPIAWTEAQGGYWVLSGYKPLFEAARDDERFSSARNSYGGEGLSVVIPKTPMHPFHIPIEIDPPEFRKWRKLDQPDHGAGGGRRG